MTGVISLKNNVNNVNNMVNDIANGCYYFFVGGTFPWQLPYSDSNPPPANNSYYETDQSIYHDIVFGKTISNSDISFLIPFIPWTNNTLYLSYDQESNSIFSGNSYVVTSSMSVYKCIDNNNESNSTVQPFITPTTGCFQTSDGYTWKYMFTVPVNANTQFTTNYFIPCVPNTFVVNNAIPGTIDVVRVLNGGSNWQTFNEGFLNAVINYSSVVLGNTQASPIDNFYTGSSIYLKAGLGADQIRPITGYQGGSKTVTVNPPFNTYVNLNLNNGDLSGTWILGETVNQNLAQVAFLYPQGFFNYLDNIIQSDTGVTAQVTVANSIVMTLENLSNNGLSSCSGVNAYPIFNTSSARYPLTGTVTINTGSNSIYAGGANGTANLLTLTVNNYIQIGTNANLNVRRIASILNANHATVSIPFANSLLANACYQVNNAVEPTSVTLTQSNGIITQTNLTSLRLTYGNVSSNGIGFIIGETVEEFNGNNVSLSSNAIVSFVNSSTLILSDVAGTISPGNFLVGMSSTLEAQIINIISYPNITIANALGTFIAGSKVYASYVNNQVSGSATLLSFTSTPGQTTEYIISPQVNIIGDGSNVSAYCVVNNSPGSCNEITEVVMINVGEFYSNAIVNVTANSLYGNNAVLYPVVSPIYGHGSNPIQELGARYAGISITFNNAQNESYYFPNYGSYRRIGILRNPLFQQLLLSYSTPTVQNFHIQLINNAFANNEIIYQYSTKAAAQIISCNSTFIQVNNINGTFTTNAISNTGNNLIIGLTTSATANIVNGSIVNFDIISNNQLIYQNNTQATGYLVDTLANDQIIVTNIPGNFATSNVVIYDPTNNASANLNFAYGANGTSNVTNIFGMRFNQTCRIALHSNTATPFQVGEYVNQVTTNASGIVIDSTHEIDIAFNSPLGVFSPGILLTDSNTAGNGIITFSNTTYLRITGVNGNFNAGDKITCLTGNASISNVYPVLVLGDIQEVYPFQINFEIIGNTSGAIGYNEIFGTIVYPDLTRNTGDVLYINNITPITLTPNTKEIFSVVIQL